MKKLFSVLLVFVILLSGCNTDGYPEQTDESTQPTQTEKRNQQYGYPSGQIQREYIFVNGYLYILNGEPVLDTLPEGATLLGTIICNNVKEVPSQNFHSANVAVNTKVYAVPADDLGVYIFSEKFCKYYQFVRVDMLSN